MHPFCLPGTNEADESLSLVVPFVNLAFRLRADLKADTLPDTLYLVGSVAYVI